MERSSRLGAQRFALLPAAADFLGCTDKALRKLVERRAVPFRRVGRRLIFDLQELERWFAHLPGVTLDEALERRLGMNDR